MRGSLGLAPARAQQVTLDVLYAFPAFAKFHEPIAAEFMKRQPDIKIQFRAPAASYDEGHQTMMRQAVTNQLPDVYYSGLPPARRARAHARASASRSSTSARCSPRSRPRGARRTTPTSILALGKVDGKLYGLRVQRLARRSCTSTPSS